ncbi:hypothetical protein B0J12DRAFT_637634, partial [Macrophomina phaseolina]
MHRTCSFMYACVQSSYSVSDVAQADAVAAFGGAGAQRVAAAVRGGVVQAGAVGDAEGLGNARHAAAAVAGHVGGGRLRRLGGDGAFNHRREGRRARQRVVRRGRERQDGRLHRPRRGGAGTVAERLTTTAIRKAGRVLAVLGKGVLVAGAVGDAERVVVGVHLSDVKHGLPFGVVECLGPRDSLTLQAKSVLTGQELSL